MSILMGITVTESETNPISTDSAAHVRLHKPVVDLVEQCGVSVLFTKQMLRVYGNDPR